MQPAIDQKLQDYWVELCEHSEPLPELRLKRIENDISTTLDRVVADNAMTAFLLYLLGKTYARGDKLDKAHDAFRRALQRAQGDIRTHVLIDDAATLILMGQVQEAATEAIEAARSPLGYRTINLANLAEALYRLGDVERAQEIFNEARRVAADNGEAKQPSTLLALAAQAAEIGRWSEAAELFAACISVKNGAEYSTLGAALDAATPGILEVVQRFSALQSALAREKAFQAELAKADTARTDDDPRDEEARAVFESTQPLRDAALASTLK